MINGKVRLLAAFVLCCVMISDCRDVGKGIKIREDALYEDPVKDIPEAVSETPEDTASETADESAEDSAIESGDASTEDQAMEYDEASEESPAAEAGDTGETVTGEEVEDDSKSRSWKEREDIFKVSSGFYRKLNRGEDVNILVNGDSIGAGSGASKGNSWTDLLKSYIESEYSVSCNLTNISMGGNESYAGYVMENTLDDGIEYDLMLICYGQNDNEAAISPEYEAMIRAAEKKYPNCNIISVLESSQRDYTKKMETIDALAEYYDIRIADTIAEFNKSGKPYEELTVDALHPNDEGYRLYFEAVKKVIETETESDTGVENIERKPILPEVSEYDTFSFFPAEQFVRINETSYALSLDEAVRGVIGIRHVLCPVNGEIVIKADGIECIRRSISWDLNFNKDYIYKADSAPHSASHSIEISFPSGELADGFKGLIFTGG